MLKPLDICQGAGYYKDNLTAKVIPKREVRIYCFGFYPKAIVLLRPFRVYGKDFLLL